MLIDPTNADRRDAIEAVTVGILANAGNRLSAIADTVSDSDFLAEFLQLKVSPNTRRTWGEMSNRTETYAKTETLTR